MYSNTTTVHIQIIRYENTPRVQDSPIYYVLQSIS